MTVKMTIDDKEVEYETAADLIEVLQRVPGDTLVVMSRDAEGNGYSPWAAYTDRYRYEAETTWSGEIRDPDEKNGEEFYYDDEEREQLAKLPRCIVLWPTN